MLPRLARISKCLLAIVAIMLPARLHAQSTLIPLSNGMTEMVFDHSGRYLYVTVPGGLVRRYNLSSGQFDASYSLGGSVGSLDIAPDDSCLLVTHDQDLGGTQGTLHRIDLPAGTITNLSYNLVPTPGEMGGWAVRFASNHLAFLTTNWDPYGFGEVPIRQVDLSTNTISPRTDVDTVAGLTGIARSADATRLYFWEPGPSNFPVLTYSAVTNTFSPVIETDLTLFYNTCAVNRNGTLLATTLWEYGVTLDKASDFTYVHNFPDIDRNVQSSVAFDAVTDTLYWVKFLGQRIIAYDTNTFEEKFHWDIGEYVQPASGEWNPFVASPDGRYLALGTQSGIRLYSVPGTPPDPPAAYPTLWYRHGMVFDHAGKHLYIATGPGLVQRFTVPDGQLDHVYYLGGTVYGIDIAADDSFLIAAQNNPGIATAVFQRIDLKSDAVTNISYPRHSYENGMFDVKIASNGTAFGSSGCGSVPVRQLDLSTNTIVERHDANPTEQDCTWTQLHRSADGSWLLYLPGLVAYNALTDSFSAGQTDTYDGGASDVNHNGTLLANVQAALANVQFAGAVFYTRSDFSVSHMLSQLDSGIAFDAKQDIVYGVSSTTDEIIAYETNSFSELFRIPIGDDMDAIARPFESGTLIASPDGRYLALYTPTNVRLIDVVLRTSVAMNIPKVYGISLIASPPATGAVTGAGTYAAGSSVTLTATPASGYDFGNWVENGNVVSTSPSYTVTADADRLFVANFIEIPTVTLSVSPTSIRKQGVATFTVQATTINPSHPTIVSYSMSGNASPGTNYTLSGTPNQVTIPPGQSSASITLTATPAKTKGGGKAVMTLNSGAGYNLFAVVKKKKTKTNPNQATVTIRNK